MCRPLNSKTINKIIDLIEKCPGITRLELQKSLGTGAGTIRRYIEYLKDINKIAYSNGKNNTFCYYLIESPKSPNLEDSCIPELLQQAIQRGNELKPYYEKLTPREFYNFAYTELYISYEHAKSLINLAETAPKIYEKTPNPLILLLPQTPRAFKELIKGYRHLSSDPIKQNEWLTTYLSVAQQNYRSLKGSEIITLWHSTVNKKNWDIPYYRKLKVS